MARLRRAILIDANAAEELARANPNARACFASLVGMSRLNRTALCLELPQVADGAGAPGAIEIIPAPGLDGRIVGRDGRTWLFDALAAASVIAAYRARGIDVVIDRNHAAELRAPDGDESPAAGWVSQLEIRDGALWGAATWTPRGAQEVAAREYRYLSPVFDYEPDTGRIVRLVSVGLVNKPNLRLPALNSEDPMHKTGLSAAIIGALALAATATEDDAIAAIAALKTERDTALNSERSPSLDRFVPRSDYDAAVTRAANAENALKQRDADAHKQAVDREIEDALKAGKITPAAVDYHRASCSDQAGLERFRTFVAAAPAIGDPSGLEKRKPEGGSTALNADEERVIALTGVSREDFIKARDARAAA